MSQSLRFPRALLRLCVALTVFIATSSAFAQVLNSVEITGVYGAGGNSGAFYNADYIELFNAGSTSVSLDGWAIQYASAGGAAVTTISPIESGHTLLPGQFFLISATPGTNGVALPVTVDFVMTTATPQIAFAAAGGKIYLTNTTTKLATACPMSDPSIIDAIGAAGSAASCYLGTGPAPAVASTVADIRTNVCANTQDNSKDFVTQDFSKVTGVIRDSSTTKTPCSGGGVTPIAPAVSNAAFTPSTAAAGDTTLLTATVTPGTSSVTSVKADDSAIGGTAADTLHDDGLNGDVTARDGIYSFRITSVAGTVASHSVTVTATDSTLNGTGNASLTITATSAPAASMVTVNASTSSAVLGSSVIITAVVTGNKGTPTGSVTFSDGGHLLGPGVAGPNATWTYTTTTLALGPHAITAAYSGDGVYPSYTVLPAAAANVTITPVPVPTFALSLGNLSLIATTNSKMQTTSVNVNMTNGFNSPVSFTCSGAPAGTRCSFSPATLTASGSSTLTIGIDGAALHPHDSPFGKRSGETALAFLLLGGLPLALRRKRFAGTLMAALLLGVIALGVAGCGADNATPNGTSTLTVTATGGGVTQTANLNLNVQ
jgi:hypothetical protein